MTTDRIGGCNAATGGEVGVVQPQGKDVGSHREARNRYFAGASRGNVVLLTP